ncbi:MAG: hypothetical protein LAP85_22740 [Acidobacteriia bacterium]|nr:hypothetical protein [Terriglobia bacterium]
MVEPSSTEMAHENLQYIRKTLDAAGRFTAVPGKGLMAAGVTTFAGVAVNLLVTGAPWGDKSVQQPALEVWGIVLVVSLAIVSYGIYRKSRQTRTRLQPPLIRKLLWSLCPALFVGGVLTNLAVRTQNLGWLPAIWLGCYGAAITNGGLVSVAPVRYLGLSLLATAAAAALAPQSFGLVWLAVGFGWLHLVFGAYIAWRHNG